LSHISGPFPGDDVIKEQPKNSLTYPFSNATYPKTRTQISKVFFSMQTRRLYESFEGSNSSLACSCGELSQATLAASGRLMQFSIFVHNGVFGP